MVIQKEIIDNQLYLYMNGKLIYKRWLKTGESKIFDVMTYDKYTLTSIKDAEANCNPTTEGDSSTTAHKNSIHNKK
jgi:hypothetical protein